MFTYHIETTPGVINGVSCLFIELTGYTSLPFPDKEEPVWVPNKLCMRRTVFEPNFLCRLFGDTLEKRAQRTIRELEGYATQAKRVFSYAQ